MVTTWGAGASASPQWLQNRLPGGFAWAQERHTAVSGWPQALQNLAPSKLCSPQRGHSIDPPRGASAQSEPCSLGRTGAETLQPGHVKSSDFRFHDLRHARASYLALAGVPLKVAQEQLGHEGGLGM